MARMNLEFRPFRHFFDSKPSFLLAVVIHVTLVCKVLSILTTVKAYCKDADSFKMYYQLVGILVYNVLVQTVQS